MSMRNITKREILIAIVALLVGVGFGFYSNSNKVKTNKQITKRIIDNCVQSLTAANTLISIYSESYKEVSMFFLDRQSCDIELSKKKLEALNKSKEKSEEEVRRLTGDMDIIIEDLKGN